MLKYLSPTSIALALEDPMAFHRKYVLGQKETFVQTPAMALGAAFDAYLKGEIRDRLYGDKGIAGELFERNVDPQNRDHAKVHGYRVFKAYLGSGFLGLMEEVSKARGVVRMEETVEDVVAGVPLLGKPDLYWYDDSGRHTVLDFKVNGYMSKSKMSPKKTGDWVAGVNVHDLKPVQDWVLQLCVYGWVLGEGIGADTMYGIEQMLGPDCLYHKYRWRVPREDQVELMGKIKDIWEKLTTLGRIVTPEQDEACRDSVFNALIR